MAKPKLSEPNQRLFVSGTPAQAARLERAAVTAGNETGKAIPATELHRRAMPALLACVESCAACRAGTCDGSVHAVHVVVHVDGGKFVLVDSNGKTGIDDGPLLPAPKIVAANDKMGAVGTSGQVGLFSGPAPEAHAKPKGKAPKKPREVTPKSPEHTRLVDVYHLEFVRVRGEKPAYTSRDFAAFKSLLNSQGFDRACELIKNAFADEFWSKRVTIRKIADDPSTFVGTPKTTESQPSAIQGGKDEVPW